MRQRQLALWLFLASAAVLLCSHLAAGRDVFVNNVTGDDLASGAATDQGPLGGPVRTIARALQLVEKGGRILLAATDEPYREPICLSGGRHRGTERYPLVIDGGGAILDGTVLAATGAWQHYQADIFAMRPRRLAHQQLFRDGEPLEQSRPGSWAGEIPSLQPLQWTLQRGRILLRVEKDRLPTDYDLRHAGLQTGISIYNTEHVRIEDLIVQGFQQDGINVHDTVRDCLIERVECRANGRSGISIGGASRVRVLQAICYDNGRSQIRVEGYAKAVIDDCDLDDQSVEPLDIRGGQVVIDGVAVVR